MIERIPWLVEGHVLRQHHGQVLFRHRHHIAFYAMNDRDRTAPIALARNAPVAQAEVHLTLTNRRVIQQRRSQFLCNELLCLLGSQTVEGDERVA
jgi:hypothetical protein